MDRNEIILTAGQVCRYEYFILNGCLRSFYVDEHAIEHTTMFAIEGWWTGNLKSFVRDAPSEFDIQAFKKKTTLIRIHKNKIEELYSQVSKFERYFRILLQNRLLATQDRVNHHLSTSAS